MENIMMIMMDIDWPSVPTLPKPTNSDETNGKFILLLEVYIDDFIGVLQTTNEHELRQCSRRILEGINNVFPPPNITESKMGPPVSEKKLIADGTWATRKEILGWMFDGIERTIELPEAKCKQLLQELKDIRKLKKVNLKRFQKLHGRLQFTSIAIPCGKPILGQLDRYIAAAARSKSTLIKVDTDLSNILRDWSALLRMVGRRPTNVKELVEHPPTYQGFVDASKWGVGGVWFGGKTNMIPITWFFEWPQEIRDQFCSSSNKTGSLTISDLELTGILLHWMVLEHSVDPTTLNHNSVAIWCDNQPAVASSGHWQSTSMKTKQHSYQ